MPPSAAPSRLPLAALLAIVLIGAAMRFWQARESLWLDELHTAWCAMGPLAEVAQRATIGNQSPLFFWLEWLVVQLLGPSELAVRLPSLVAGSLLPVALYVFIGRWTCQPWLGVLAAWLTAVDPVQIFYATEARPYALVQLLAVLHICVLAELLACRSRLPGGTLPESGEVSANSGSGSASRTYSDIRPLWLHVAFVVIAALLFHLHYTAALLFPAEIAAVAAVKLSEPDRAAYRWRSFATLWLLIALLCLPALPNVLAIYSRRTNWEAFVPQQSLWSLASLWLLVSLLPWSWSALVVLIGQASRWFLNPPNQGDAHPPILSLCWLLVPLVLAWLLTATDVARLFFLRYLIASAPAAIVLVILAVGMVPWRQAKIAVGLAAALLALVSPVLPQLAKDGRLIADRRDNWRATVAHFNQQPGRDHYPVLLVTQLIEADALRGPPDPDLRAYCLFPIHSLYPIKADPANLTPLPRTNPDQLTPEVRNLVRSRGGAWIILARRDEAANKIVDEMLVCVQGPRSKIQSHDKQWFVTQRRSFGTVHVILLRQL